MKASLVPVVFGGFIHKESDKSKEEDKKEEDKEEEKYQVSYDIGFKYEDVVCGSA